VLAVKRTKACNSFRVVRFGRGEVCSFDADVGKRIAGRYSSTRAKAGIAKAVSRLKHASIENWSFWE